jgi:hypothetical protein
MKELKENRKEENKYRHGRKEEERHYVEHLPLDITLPV